MSAHDLSIELVSKACKEYKNLYKELLKNLKKCTNDYRSEKRDNFIDEFSDKYLGLYLWKCRLHKCPTSYDNENVTPEIIEKATFHFQFKGAFSEMRPYKFINQQDSQKFWDFDLNLIFFGDLEYFIYPHSMLPNFWKVYKKLCKSPISKDILIKYDKALKLYKEISKEEKTRNFSLEKWIKCLTEWDDEEFVIQNIEKKLSENIFDKDFWKDYIKYLKKTKNTKAMLGVYSRFCGLFLNDKKMEKEFIKEAEKFGIHVGEQLLDYKEFGSILPFQLPVKNGYCNKKINLETVFPQNLVLPNSILIYAMKDTVLLQKFQKSCKYLFILRPTPICHRFVIASRPTNDYYFISPKAFTKDINFDEQSLTITAENSELKNLKNLFITNFVYIQSVFNVLRLSNILKCIYRCEIKYLVIENQTMLFKDYQLLTKAKTIKEIKFFNAQIWNENGFLVQFEDIMENLPNAVFIELSNTRLNMRPYYNPNMGPCYNIPVEINKETFQKISNFKRNKKIQHFSLLVGNSLFDPISFIQFIENNLYDGGSEFHLYFQNNVEQTFQQNCYVTIANYVMENRQPGKNISGSFNYDMQQKISFAL